MPRLILLPALVLIGLTACAEMSRVPETEMQKSYGRYGADDYSGRRD